MTTIPIHQPAAEETPAAEILRLLREIHASVCGMGGGGSSKPKKEPRVTIGDHALRIMSDGRLYSPFELWEVFQKEGLEATEGSINNAVWNLAEKGILERPRKGIYRLIKNNT